MCVCVYKCVYDVNKDYVLMFCQYDSFTEYNKFMQLCF